MSQSKRELRAERKAAREAHERAEALAKTRRRRFITLGGLTAAAAAILVIAIAVSASGGATKTPTATSDAAKLVAGIPEKDGVLGDPKAKITVTEYLDPQCPICAEASKAAAAAPDQHLRQDRQGQAQGGDDELPRPGLRDAPRSSPPAPRPRASSGRSWRPSTPPRAPRTRATSPTTS